MAKAPDKSKAAKKPRKGATKKAAAEPSDRALDAMMALAGQLGWRDLTLTDIAGEAGLTLAELRNIAGSKQALLGKFMQRIDQAVLAGAAADDPAEPVKDRLFDVCMQRFDALQPWREAIKAIARDIPVDPMAAICLGLQRRRSMIWMLEKAGVSSAGLKGRVRAAGLNAIMLSAIRVWLKDDSEDMSATMARLDRDLARADKLVQSLQGGKPFQRTGETANS